MKVTHNLGTRGITIQLYLKSTGQQVYTSMKIVDENTIEIDVSSKEVEEDLCIEVHAENNKWRSA
ncbi:MAG TPA: hypothetical protein VL098_04280 [Flavipsychrobacter sp.]|nr:hypothetical protein [Flavipsychrobacter sp.]